MRFLRRQIKNEKIKIDSVLYLLRLFNSDVTAAILVSQNNETAAMLVSQTSPLGVELFSYANVFFVRTYLHRCWPRE